MQLQEHKNVYASNDEVFSFQDTLLDDISFKVFVECSTAKFIQYQKDILEEFVADFTNEIKVAEELDSQDIKDLFEQHLQLLNTKLKQFAEKVRDIERFQLKWLIQLVVDNQFMASMIGDVSIMIMRDQRTFYSQTNSVDLKSKIDLCSDFVEWELQRDDQILYVWLKFADVMDAHDRKEMESLLAEEEDSEWVLSYLEELLSTRVEKQNIGFIISYFVQGPTINITPRGSGWLKLKWVAGKWKKYITDLWDKINNSESVKNVKKQFLENKIYFVWIILVVLILIFVYALISQIIDTKNHTNQFKTSSGAYVDLNINDIQNKINEFKTLEPSSDSKTAQYAEISNMLDTLEDQSKWLEDVASLRAQLETNYLDDFRVTQFKTLDELNKIAGRDTLVMTFNPSELSALGTPHTIANSKGVMIWGTKWAIIGLSSETNRWTVQPYNTSDLDGCIAALKSDSLYCYNTWWEIYLIDKSNVTPVYTDDGDFRAWIGWLWTYNKRNLYVFKSNIFSVGNILLSRYQTDSDGTFANFKQWSPYSVSASWVDFGKFSSFAIDGNFFGWANWKLYLFWREDVAWTSLNYRQINIKWWNPFTEKYSNNVKIITSNETKYIFTFDKDQQLFTVYTTEKTKLNDENKKSYQLVYLLSFKFDISGTIVYDVDVPANTWNSPELYILSSNGVNKIALYEYINAITGN